MKPISTRPQTSVSLQEDLERIGVERGMTLMVHSSLRSIGWVVGGPTTVVRALMCAIGTEGTLSMPSATPLCSDPATWTNPAVPKEWQELVREHLPIFDVETTPTSLGAIPETFRKWPGTLRSNHPVESVCACGPMAEQVTSSHPLAFSEGPGGPFGRLFDLDSSILLIGVGFNRCTALHHAESLVKGRRVQSVRFPVLRDGQRTWMEVQNIADDLDTHFPIIGQRFMSARGAKEGLIGEAHSIFLSMRSLVDFAVDYFEQEL